MVYFSLFINFGYNCGIPKILQVPYRRGGKRERDKDCCDGDDEDGEEGEASIIDRWMEQNYIEKELYEVKILRYLYYFLII